MGSANSLREIHGGLATAMGKLVHLGLSKAPAHSTLAYAVVGATENAVKTQIWTALIAMLLLKFLQLKSTWAWSLSNLAAMLRFNLLSYRDLWTWLDSPYQVPVVEPGAEQLYLFA